jgi:RNA polymerase sigma factor FliA
MIAISAENELLNSFLANRNPAVREKLILSHVPLVHFILIRLGISQNGRDDYEELANQGLLGLIEAVDHYDPAYGTRFSTYASMRIRGKVIDFLRSQDWLSRSARSRVRAVQKTFQNLLEKNGCEPTEAEICASLGLEAEQVQQAFVDTNHIIISLDAALASDPDEELSLYDVFPDEHQSDPSDIASENDMKRQMVQAIQNLSEREQLVLSLYYYEELTLKEIGQVLGITESRVCQLHARAVLNLKATLKHE